MRKIYLMHSWSFSCEELVVFFAHAIVRHVGRVEQLLWHHVVKPCFESRRTFVRYPLARNDVRWLAEDRWVAKIILRKNVYSSIRIDDGGISNRYLQSSYQKRNPMCEHIVRKLNYCTIVLVSNRRMSATDFNTVRIKGLISSQIQLNYNRINLIWTVVKWRYILLHASFFKYIP